MRLGDTRLNARNPGDKESGVISSWNTFRIVIVAGFRG